LESGAAISSEFQRNCEGIAMEFCHKQIHLLSLTTVALATALLLPTSAFAQVLPAPASAPPAVAVPVIPPTLKVPAAKAPIIPAPAEATPAPIAPPALAEPNAIAAPSTPIALTLPRDLSPWGMFLAADIVVKAVMIGLAFASVLTWTIWFAKAFELLTARRQLRRAIEALNEARSVADAMTRMNDRAGDVAMLLRAAETELRLSADAISADGVKERIASRLERIEAAAGRRMIRGTGILATVGATAPFVGLFGTVWGIMNSFIGISKQHTTNLAVVAPGIAEALLATALGLVAAIPAVVMYNMFSRWTAGFRAQQADAAAEIMRLASRDLDRGAFNRPSGERCQPITAAE
jgi:biopolymer transport protein ExbB